MAELRPDQKRGKPKKLDRETLRKNPLIGTLARIRLRELKAARATKKASELPFD